LRGGQGEGHGHEDALRALDPDHPLVPRARLHGGGRVDAARAAANLVQPRPSIEGFHQGVVMARMVNCIKLQREAEGLDFPPYPGELGKRLYESVSKEAWKAWLEHQKMLVNENRLNLADPRARKYLEEQMRKHFFVGVGDSGARE